LIFGFRIYFEIKGDAMERISAYLLALIVPLFLIEPVMAENKIPLRGDMLPELVLPVPQDVAQKAYLGLTSNDIFQIPRIKASVLIIQILSMYCPHCQREAPRINTFYHKIENDAALHGKVKIIGIGVGNSAFEIDFFRKKYGVPFPLFPDPDFVFHKKIGEVRTPYFFGVHLTGPEAGRVFYSQLGGPDDALAFLEKLLQSAGL
jgi:thiol-disulfide isomerase/thioredoxin